MASIRALLIKKLIVKNTMKHLFDPTTKSIDSMRLDSTKLANKIKIPKTACIDKVKVNGIDAEWLRHSTVSSQTKRVILYFHSEAFCMGYGNPHRDLALRVSEISDSKILAIDYRLAPEYQYPAANDDCINTYKWLLDNGYNNTDIVFLGDSAGAGLVLMTLISFRKSNLPLPAASVLISLLGGDLRNYDGESYRTNQMKDPSNTIEGIKKFGQLYLGSTILNPAITEDFTGYPPMLIQVGGDEILLSDSVRLFDKIKKDGVEAKIEIYPEMWHLFQGFAMIIPEAKKAVNNIGIFIRKKFKTESI